MKKCIMIIFFQINVGVLYVFRYECSNDSKYVKQKTKRYNNFYISQFGLIFIFIFLLSSNVQHGYNPMQYVFMNRYIWRAVCYTQ